MSWFSEWASDWLHSEGRSQSELAALGGVDPANVSRWLSGQSRPDKEAVGKLMQNVSPAEASTMLIAWLRDMLPLAAEDVVRILPAQESCSNHLNTHQLADDSPDYVAGGSRMLPSGISGDLAERLLYFARLAVLNPDIRKIVDVCYDAAKRAEKARP